MGVTRIHFFDWLRATAVVGIVAYHAVLPFAWSPGVKGFWVRNAEHSDVLTVLVILLETFGLPVLFLVAGASARLARRTRSPRAFLAERARRLLVPFAAGALVLTPLLIYIAEVHEGRAAGGLIGFLAGWPAFGVEWARGVGLSPRLFEIGFHLWFLGWLFAFSALGIPVFALLSSPRGRAVVDALARRAAWPGATLLFAIPVALPPLVLFALSPEERDWWTFSWYGAIFVVGYVLYGDERLIAAARRDLAPALIVGALASAGLFGAGFMDWVAAHEEVDYTYDATYVLMLGLYGTAGWSWTLALFGAAMRLAPMQRPMPARAAEAVLPIYILHLPLVLAISFFVVQWPLGFWPKVVGNVTLGVAATVAVTAAALRVPFIRVLLGVHARPRETPGPQRSIEVVGAGPERGERARGAAAQPPM